MRCPSGLKASVYDCLSLLPATVLVGVTEVLLGQWLAAGDKSSESKIAFLSFILEEVISLLCKQMKSSLAVVKAVSATALGFRFHLNMSAFTAPSDSSEIIFALSYKRNLGDLQSMKLSLHNVLLTILLYGSLFQPQLLLLLSIPPGNWVQ